MIKAIYDSENAALTNARNRLSHEIIILKKIWKGIPGFRS